MDLRDNTKIDTVDFDNLLKLTDVGETKMEIDWRKIEGGFRGFEKLALLFVENQFPNPSWKKTGETRDGNTDAIAYVFGYQSDESQQSQWWMEAKYSTEQNLVTRYRLDATIVSAILAERVEKVIFITNVAIRAKTIIDIRNVLTKATSCHDIQFCTKPILENWLCKNPFIYQKFFPNLDSDEVLEQSEDMYLTQEIDFYQRSSDFVAFSEPCKILYSNERYVGHFSVYCESDRTVTLRKNQRCRGISIRGKHTFELHSGNNTIKFEISLSSNLPDESSFYFLLGNIEVFPASFIHFSPQPSIYHELPGQKKILESIRKTLRQFLRKNHCVYSVISAASGSGKTEMLEQLVSDPVLADECLFYRSFSFSDTDNSLLLVDFILFLLFPYLAPDEIDANYLDCLEGRHMITCVHKLIQLRHNYNALVDFLIQECTPEDFLPHSMKINARIVYLDNVQNLSDSLFLFFKKLLVELQKRKVPIYMVITVNESIFSQGYWTDLVCHCDIEIYHFQLSIEDIIAVIGGSLQVKETTKNLLKSGSLTVVELFSFAKYASSEAIEIETTEQLLAAMRIFQYSDVFKKNARAKFLKLFEQYPKCRALCDTIFYSYTPVQISGTYTLELLAMLENNLVRYDLYNRLTPRNEAIWDCYCSYFKICAKQDDVFISKEDRLRLILENEQSSLALCQAAQEIITMSNNKQYNSVTYIGKTQFEHEASRHILEGRLMNRTLFLQMYFAYSYATHMQSNVKDPRTHFERIITRCNRSIDEQLLWLCLRAQWEIANSDFENIRYYKVLEDVQVGIATLKKMQQYGFFSGAIYAQLKFYDFMAIKSFVEAELGRTVVGDSYSQIMWDSRKYGFIDRYFNTKIRLALVQITINTQESYHALEEGIQYFKEHYNGNHKMYLFGEFSRLYYEMVLENHPTLIGALTKIHEEMKSNQHNNYRKRNFAMATYYYWMGDIETGSRYLFSEIFMIRNLAQRATGFYYETLALHKLRNNEPQQAIQSLRKAKEIFASIESYAQIPEHNISVLETISVEKVMIQFWQGTPFLSDTYYLDLRITW
ncbi:MAG: hypothetical protein OSJ61_15080 [Lachnospiraceae bacterium]|nr:hypothetical protein [Lachnospiraceae bacterium]